MQAPTQLIEQTESGKIKRTSAGDHPLESSHEYLDIAKQIGSKAITKGSSIVRSNPGYSLLGAAAVGFLAGAFLTRKSK